MHFAWYFNTITYMSNKPLSDRPHGTDPLGAMGPFLSKQNKMAEPQLFSFFFIFT